MSFTNLVFLEPAAQPLFVPSTNSREQAQSKVSRVRPFLFSQYTTPAAGD